MASPLRDGDGGTPADPRLHSSAAPLRLDDRHPRLRSYYSVSDHKIRRLYVLIHLPRFVACCFSLIAIVFNASDSSASWLGFDPFRLVHAAYGFINLYSLVKLRACEDLSVTDLPPELFKLWPDFQLDQVIAYLALSAGVVGAMTARRLGRSSAGDTEPPIDIQMNTVFLGIVGFGFLALSAVISGFRIASFVLTGSLPPPVRRASAVDVSRCESYSAESPRSDVRRAS